MIRALSLVVVAALMISGCTKKAEETPPPIIFVMVDTLRADYLGTYGFAGDVSPHIDALAAEGVVFDRCFAQSPWTKPSIATVHTGLYPEVHKVFTEGGKFLARGTTTIETDALSEDAVTLAEVLRSRGYATAAFVANPWVRASHGFAQGFDVYDSDGADNEMPGAEMVDRSIEWLGERKSGEPFFLYIHLMDVHGPYTAPQAHYDALAGSSAAAPVHRLSEDHYQRIPPYLRMPAWARQQESREVAVWRQRYAAGVRWMDASVGTLFAALRERGLLDAALVIVTSDHGEALYEHRGWDHGYTAYEHQIHVPLVLRFPGGAHGGRRVGDVVGLVDVMPTLLAVAGAELPPGVQGRDLTPVLSGQKGSDVMFTEAIKWRPGQRVVRTAEHKLIIDRNTDELTLYDLQADPAESRDVATEDPETVDRLRAQLVAHEAANAAHGGLSGRAAEVPADVAERLRALGYLE